MTDLSHLPVRSRVVAAALADAGVLGEVVELPDSARTAAEAAAALGTEVGAIANSLIFWADDRPLLVLTSGRHRVDTVALARQLGTDARRPRDARPGPRRHRPGDRRRGTARAPGSGSRPWSTSRSPTTRRSGRPAGPRTRSSRRRSTSSSGSPAAPRSSSATESSARSADCA